MKLLAIETTSNACSVALQNGTSVVEKHVEEARVHTRILVPTIRELLDEYGVAASELAAVVLGNGPGSFIGMRIGASVAQGIAHAAGIKIVPISSLAAVAADVFAQTDAGQTVVTQDARMDEVYVGFFERGASGFPLPLGDERITAASELVTDSAGLYAAGAGFSRYPEMLSNNTLIDVSQRFALPRAVCLLPMAGAALEQELAIEPDLLQPAYLRTQVATPPKP